MAITSPAHQVTVAQQEATAAVAKLHEANKILDQHQQTPGPDWTRLQFHHLDTENPHDTTAAHIGLGLLKNYPMAGLPAIQASSRNHYLSALGAKLVFDTETTKVPSISYAQGEPTVESGHLVLDPATNVKNTATFAVATDIELKPVAIDTYTEVTLILTKDVADAPVVRLGNEPGVSPVCTKVPTSDDDSVIGTFMYTFYMGYGFVPHYRVDQLV